MRRALVFIVVPLACCAPAQAATVTARQYDELTKVEETVTLTEVEYRADPGEVNVVRLWIEGDRLRIADGGAPLRAVGLCEQVDAHEASCPRINAMPISTADGHDTWSPRHWMTRTRRRRRSWPERGTTGCPERASSTEAQATT